MVPVRLRLEGFKSYREPQEFDFSTAPLWALSGPNGAGKSSAFDAIYFALFGPKEPGIPADVKLKDLVHHGQDAFSVEFDFDLGDRRYRVRRSWRKTSGSAYAVLQLPDETPVPGTDSEDGLKTWVADEIGLSHVTFTRSVYLRQNHGVELVEGKPRDRYEVLGEVVDLRRFEELHGRAAEKAREADARLKMTGEEAEQKLKAATSEVDASDDAGAGPVRAALADAIAADEAALGDGDRALQVLQTRRDGLAATRTLAEAWEARAASLEGLTTERAGLADTLDQAEAIRAAVARDEALAQAASALGAHAEATRAAAGARDALATAQDAHASATSACDAAASDLEARRAAHETLNREVERLADQRRGLADATATSPLLDALAEWDALSEQSRIADEAADACPADLDARLDAAREALDASQAAERALPPLRLIHEHRADLEAATRSLEESDPEASRRAQQAAGRAVQAAETALAARLDEQRKADHRATTAAEALRAAKEARNAFIDAAGDPTCRLCGHDLTPDHVDAHRAELEDALADAERTAADTQSGSTAAAAAVEEARGELERAREAATEAARTADADRRTTEEAAAWSSRALKALASAYDALDDATAAAVAPAPPPDAEGWLTTSFPTEADLTALAAEASHRGPRQEAHDQALQRAGERDRHRMTAQHLASKAGDVAERHDLQRARAQREAAADAQRQLEALDPRLANARSRCAEAERDLALAREAHESAKKEASEARQAVALAEAALEREAEALERTRGALPPLAAPHADDPEQGVVALESSRSEIAELVALAECLADAEAHAVTLDGEIRRLTKEQDATPEAARRPATEVESEIADADAERSRLQGERAAASARLERRRPLLTRLAELDDARATAAANARRYRRLSSLLGRQGLQRALIRRAEAVIADHAASLLDHLSGGRLDLRLRSQTGTADKALDLVALDRDTGGRPLPVASLSGSQKFRVAVALALAIGRYASEAGRPIRAVVIDEGFGGLDAEGLDAMADALHDLQSVLDRVLLVSHQPDFSAHFPNRYAVALHDGASVVSTADPTA